MAKGNWLKPLLCGLAGGVIALSGGVAYQVVEGNHPLSTSSSSPTTNVKIANTNVETDVTSAVKNVENSVVSVLNYQRGASSDLSDIFGDEAASSSGDNELQLAGEGSGVIYKKSDGHAYIVTNNHVISGNDSLEVLLASGKHVKATVVGADTFSDLAVLRISDADVKSVATFANSSKVNVGEPAIAVGSPLGSQYANTATEGIVSSLSRTVTMQNDDGDTTSINAIQTDAAINPGNSGGALINIKGQVIGITSSKISSTSDGTTSGVAVEGMGFAIPSNDAMTIAEKLVSDGKVQRPALGVQMVALSALAQSSQEQLDLPDSVNHGVVITSVQSGMPAEQAGLKEGDVITKVGDTEISTATDLQTALYKHNIGDTVKFTVYRGSSEKTVEIKLTKTTSDLSTNVEKH